MRLALSAVLVFGLVGLLVFAAVSADPTASPLPVAWLIHERIPVALLVLVAAGVAIGLASVWSSPRWYKYPVLLLEALAAGAVAFYFVSASFLPDRTLGIDVGEAFPSWSLTDQDGVQRRYVATGVAGAVEDQLRRRSLYIFYRGDW